MRLPWWARVLVVYGGARAMSAVLLLAVAQQQAATLWTDAAPSYAEFTGGMWDANWYHQIAESGYPSTLPRGEDGAVQQNAWAFYPLYPALVRAVMTVTGLDWVVAAPTVSLLLGAGAILVLYRLVLAACPGLVRGRPGLPLAAVAVTSTFVSAPVMQVGYSESLALLLVTTALLLLVRGRYLTAVPVVLALGFARPVALPLACVVLWHGAVHGYRWWGARRGSRRGDVGAVARWAALLVATVVAGFAWQWVCAAATGEPDAYFLTQEAWRGTGEVVPLRPWFLVADWLFGGPGPWLLVVLLAVVAAVVLWPAARLGPELRSWLGAYLAYLVLVLEPGTSLVRFLLLAFPLFVLVVAWTRSRVWLAVVVLAGILGQFWWISSLWQLVPPSGWPP
ncbi:hypothetical protein SAMN04489860_2244 [Paraoerskovia marina]|uniref:Mannosyltransferase (PIG-V) n=1 Tax=Paraoerskovia marina TaxID=545619 RepID=A0A1H1UMR9_9CELL|nr:hypothetical protein [Paraoerskovia marina]SDS73807.1 hypothetical protein SAMN04489860_2244 [Paraoerskovia marina]